MSSFQDFGARPIYDMILFRYMIWYGWLVHFCVWSCCYASAKPAWILFSTCTFVCPSVRSFLCYQSCEPVLMSIGTNGQWGKDMKHLTLEFKSTDVKVIQGWR